MEEIDGVCDLGDKKIIISPKTVTSEAKSKSSATNEFRGSVKKPDDIPIQSKPLEESKIYPKPIESIEEWGERYPEKTKPILKNLNLSEAYPTPQARKTLQNEQKNFNPATLTNLTKLFLKFSLTSRLNLNFSIFRAEESLKDPELLKKFGCRVCGKIKISLKLECLHNACFYCFVENTQKLAAERSFFALKACECSQCGLMPSLMFIKKINPCLSEELKISRTCTSCKMVLNVFEEFPQELNCGHLCLKCYLNEVYYGVASCLACEEPFSNILFTKQRVLTCNYCNSKGFSVLKGYRTIHKDHSLCCDCIVSLLRNEKENGMSCLICHEKLDKKTIKSLREFINKSCPCCQKIKFVSELNVCYTCCRIVCDDCNKETIKCSH